MNTDKKTIVILYSKGFYDTVALDLTARLRRDYPDCEVIAIDEDKYSNAFRRALRAVSTSRPHASRRGSTGWPWRSATSSSVKR